ncbi:MAG: hypothetical protein LLG13_09910 [Bacteroidales bacterium]|nr:hypothetical protein [Bacteroidales bacterium]
MESKYFSLDDSENNRFIKMIKMAFGFVCILVAIFWIVFGINNLKTNGTTWVAIFFLTGFGAYQIWSGMGRAKRFIEIGPDSILLKKNPIFSPVEILSPEFEKIELYPMNIIFFRKTKKKILLRFGNTFFETNEKIKDEIFDFAESKNIPLEVIEEKL